MMKHLRRDLNFLTSAVLLLAALAAIVSGIIADLWDLNDFVYHTYAGYVMAVFALIHVWLSWSRLLNYARTRFKGKSRVPTKAMMPARSVTESTPSVQPTTIQRVGHRLVSRRGAIGMAVGVFGGWAIGRSMRASPAIAHGSDLGVVYHEWSKPGVSDLWGTVVSWGQKPPQYKAYPHAPRIALPRPTADGGLTTEEAIRRRRSHRDYSGEPMALAELSRLLFYIGGINGERWGYRVRSAPSSGALYPIETYVVAHNVEGLPQGVYHYGVQSHNLAQLRVGDLRGEVVRQGIMQEFLGQANIVIFFTCIFQRMRWKYQDRTYRYGLLEAGHLGQNVYLEATSMGIGACAIGAFMDDAINAMLGVDGKEEAVVYMLAAGKI